MHVTVIGRWVVWNNILYAKTKSSVIMAIFQGSMGKLGCQWSLSKNNTCTLYSHIEISFKASPNFIEESHCVLNLVRPRIH